eukprot:6032416-Amphidinium_carterae.1
MWAKAHGSKCRDLTAVTAAVDALRFEEGSVPPPGDVPMDTCPESLPVSQAAAAAGLGSLS